MAFRRASGKKGQAAAAGLAAGAGGGGSAPSARSRVMSSIASSGAAAIAGIPVIGTTVMGIRDWLNNNGVVSRGTKFGLDDTNIAHVGPYGATALWHAGYIFNAEDGTFILSGDYSSYMVQGTQDWDVSAEGTGNQWLFSHTRLYNPGANLHEAYVEFYDRGLHTGVSDDPNWVWKSRDLEFGGSDSPDVAPSVWNYGYKGYLCLQPNNGDVKVVQFNYDIQSGSMATGWTEYNPESWSVLNHGPMRGISWSLSTGLATSYASGIGTGGSQFILNSTGDNVLVAIAAEKECKIHCLPDADASNVLDGQEIYFKAYSNSEESDVKLSANGNVVALISQREMWVEQYDLTSNEWDTKYNLVGVDGWYFTDVELSANGKYVAFAQKNTNHYDGKTYNRILIVDVDAGTVSDTNIFNGANLPSTGETYHNDITAITFDDEGTYLGVGLEGYTDGTHKTALVTARSGDAWSSYRILTELPGPVMHMQSDGDGTRIVLTCHVNSGNPHSDWTVSELHAIATTGIASEYWGGTP